jgi:hypothetical protein
MATVDRATQAYQFTLVYEGPAELTQDLEDAIFAAGCGDATLGVVGGRIVLDFCRQSASFEEALVSAIGDVRRAGLPYPLTRVEPI